MRQPLHFGVFRAAVASLVAHGLLLAAFLIAGPGQGPPSPAPSIIEGEMVTSFAPPPADSDTGVAERAPPPVDPAPSNATAPAAEERPVTARALAPPPADTPPAPEPAPPAAVADAPAAEQREPAAPATDEAQAAASTEQLAAETPAAAEAELSASAADSAASPPAAPLASKERAMLTKRLASWTAHLEADAAEPTLKWREDGHQYTAVLRRQPATDPMGMEHATVEVTTERDGNRIATELRMTRVAFSNFAQFVDRWDPEVAIHDDEIDGRFHSNSEIHVSGGPGVRPVFRGKVTLAAHDVATDNGLLGGPGFVNRRSMFPAGLETMVRRIALAPRAPPDAPEQDVQRFTRATAITFYADGTYGWRPLGSGKPEQRRAFGDKPHYLIGADDDVALEVRGTVNGTVLVYTPGRIVIADDLRYAHDPHDPATKDLLGLVAERSVEIGAPNLTGPGDLEVYASIYARGRFVIQNYLSRRSGTLRIYGSLAAGSMTASEPRFATKVLFDPRLTSLRAPGFPLSDRYELDSLGSEWRPVPDPLP